MALTVQRTFLLVLFMFFTDDHALKMIMRTNMQADPFRNQADSPMAPAEYCFEITPNDTVELSSVTKALYVGEGGDIAVTAVRASSPVVFSNVPSGSIIDVRAKMILSTGTTAANIVGLA
ncbi:MAG: hypothetical protein ABJP48_06700 [Erythrobacter sp.]